MEVEEVLCRISVNETTMVMQYATVNAIIIQVPTLYVRRLLNDPVFAGNCYGLNNAASLHLLLPSVGTRFDKYISFLAPCQNSILCGGAGLNRVRVGARRRAANWLAQKNAALE